MSDLYKIDFKTLHRKSDKNNYLVCPASYCVSMADERSPIFASDIARLQACLLELVLSQPKTKLLMNDKLNRQLVFEQRTRVFNFPDTINVKLIPISENQSTLALFSQSRYGYYDFGQNKRRIKRWLHGLCQLLNTDEKIL